MADVSTIGVFVDDQDDELGIGLAIADASIVEIETGELVVGCKFTVAQAKRFISHFQDCIDQIER